MIILFLKKFWSQILNILFIVVLLLCYNNSASIVSDLKIQFADQSQKSHIEYEKKLNDLISQKTESQKKMLEELDEINKKSQEEIRKLIVDREQKIKFLNDQRDIAIKKIKNQKVGDIKIRVSSSYENPEKVVDDIAKKFGFSVIKIK